MKIFLTFLFTAICMFSPGVAVCVETGSMIETIVFLGEENGSEVIQFHLTKDIQPKIFELAGENPRAVFDFVETVYSSRIKNKIKAGGRFVKSIRVGLHQHPVAKTRVVIDLEKGDEYTIEQRYLLSKGVLEIRVSPRKKIAELKAAPQKLQKHKTDDVIKSSDGQKKNEKPSFTPQNISKTAQEPRKSEPKRKQEKTVPVLSTEKEDTQEVIAVLPKKKILDLEPDKIIPLGADNITEEKPDEAHVLLDVSFESTMGSKEMILFKLNGFFPPVVFAIDKDNLRVVCDFLDAQMAAEVKDIMDTGGKYIRKVRVAKHESPDKVRVVLDLVANTNYDLKQIFFKEDNLFVIIINVLNDKQP